MARFRYAIDEAKIERFIKEGRGKGEGKTYKPWLTIQDVPSAGRSHRIKSEKTGRVHHFLSDKEKYAFLFYEWNDAVIDIREQYPLDREMTRQIAQDLNIKHPQDPETKCDIVMTTDFLLTVNNDGKQLLFPRSVKLIADLDKRTIAKQEIERRFWEIAGEDWGMITEYQLPRTSALNLEWAREVIDFDGLPTPYPEYWNDTCHAVLDGLYNEQGITPGALCAKLKWDSAAVISAIKHLIWHKRISIDLHKKFSLNTSAPDINLVLPEHIRRTA